MHRFFYKKYLSFLRVTSLMIILSFPLDLILFSQKTYAQDLLNLPSPGTMVVPSPIYAPVLLKGIKISPDNPLRFNFIMDVGDTHLEGAALREEFTKLIKYFLAALTVAEDDLWVNLSPYEKNRIIPEAFGQTNMGRDLLAQDYLLKQLAASLTHPDKEWGRPFWHNIYKQNQRPYDTTEIPVNIFNKVWIVPQRAGVYSNSQSVFIVESYLKVLHAQDYLAMKKSMKNSDLKAEDVKQGQDKKINTISLQLIKDIIIPEIEKEINKGKNFAQLRQIYNAVILATWFKRNLRQSLLGKFYVDQDKIAGIDIPDKAVKEKIYQRYLKAFNKGVFNFVAEDYSSEDKQIIPRKYFSGGSSMKLGPIKEWSLKDATNLTEMKPGLIAAQTDLTPESEYSSDTLVSRQEEVRLDGMMARLTQWKNQENGPPLEFVMDITNHINPHPEDSWLVEYYLYVLWEWIGVQSHNSSIFKTQSLCSMFKNLLNKKNFKDIFRLLTNILADSPPESRQETFNNLCRFLEKHSQNHLSEKNVFEVFEVLSSISPEIIRAIKSEDINIDNDQDRIAEFPVAIAAYVQFIKSVNFNDKALKRFISGLSFVSDESTLEVLNEWQEYIKELDRIGRFSGKNESLFKFLNSLLFCSMGQSEKLSLLKQAKIYINEISHFSGPASNFFHDITQKVIKWDKSENLFQNQIIIMKKMSELCEVLVEKGGLSYASLSYLRKLDSLIFNPFHGSLNRIPFDEVSSILTKKIQALRLMSQKKFLLTMADEYNHDIIPVSIGIGVSLIHDSYLPEIAEHLLSLSPEIDSSVAEGFPKILQQGSSFPQGSQLTLDELLAHPKIQSSGIQGELEFVRIENFTLPGSLLRGALGRTIIFQDSAGNFLLIKLNKTGEDGEVIYNEQRIKNWVGENIELINPPPQPIFIDEDQEEGVLSIGIQTGKYSDQITQALRDSSEVAERLVGESFEISPSEYILSGVDFLPASQKGYIGYIKSDFIDDWTQFKKSILSATADFGRLAHHRIIHTAVSEMFHNKYSREAGRFFVAQYLFKVFQYRGTGRQSGYEKSVEFPNYGANGVVRDYGEIMSLEDVLKDKTLSWNLRIDSLSKSYPKNKLNFVMMEFLMEYTQSLINTIGRWLDEHQWLGMTLEKEDSLQELADFLQEVYLTLISEYLGREPANKIIFENFRWMLLAKEMRYYLSDAYVNDLSPSLNQEKDLRKKLAYIYEIEPEKIKLGSYADSWDDEIGFTGNSTEPPVFAQARSRGPDGGQGCSMLKNSSIIKYVIQTQSISI